MRSLISNGTGSSSRFFLQREVKVQGPLYIFSLYMFYIFWSSSINITKQLCWIILGHWVRSWPLQYYSLLGRLFLFLLKSTYWSILSVNPHSSEAKLLSACFLSYHLCPFLGFSTHHRFHLCAGSTEVFYLSVYLCVYACTCLCMCRYTCLCVYEDLRTTSGNIPQHYQSILRYSLLLTWDWPARLGWLARESQGFLCVWFFRSEITHT